MRFSTVSALLGLTAGFASAAPAQPKEIQNRDAADAAAWYDITYIDKRAEEEKKRDAEADAAWYDITYIDKVKREAEEKKRKAGDPWYDITYIDKRE
ncbi:hypothetical protein DM02DRAFT_676584 [Periconia macrospinosa]|uniref:Uncharacterized protein n=1 Tax=Periconia macrospinosa TaxID=97972 RepID=A0A2V1D713_9PLEO|nr:hypothetical protein DM02DRAFT_676584 [Periconia macrospinosa]